MHYEKYRIDNSTIKAIASAKSQGRRIVCVGTTTVRVLEHLAMTGKLGLNKELPINGFLDGQTNLFIYPGYKFQIVDALITNFHLPRSSLLMLVCAFAEQVGENNDGIELIKESYRKAVEMNYRFYSFGDAMLIIWTIYNSLSEKSWNIFFELYYLYRRCDVTKAVGIIVLVL